MTVYAITDTKKGRTGIAPTYLQTTPGFDVDVTPRTSGPVGRMLSIRWPCVTHSAQ